MLRTVDIDSLEITLMLNRAGKGDTEARDAVVTAVYGRLRALARNRLRAAPAGLALQPTALVHETFVKVLGENRSFENRRHFFSTAAQAMRSILSDLARRRASKKRGGDFERVSPEYEVAVEPPTEEELALRQALQRLQSRHERPYSVVILRYFAGLTNAEAAEHLGVSATSTERDWRFARAFLRKELCETA